MSSANQGPAGFSMMMFGPMLVSVDGAPIPHLRSRKALWMLALIALRHGREVDRQWLAGTLWPDVDTSQALANLRPTLSEVRRALGSQAERVRADGRLTVSLDVDGAEIDLLEFDRLVAEDNLTGLERAAGLYRGALLEGCADDWVFQERNAREQDCLRALQKLADHANASGDHSTAIAHCRRAIAINSLWDGAQRSLMEALERSGDRNAALQVYRDFAGLLGRELGATPDEKTTEVYVRLRKSVRRREVSGHAVVEATNFRSILTGYVPHSVTPLVGREDERVELVAKLRQSRLITLTGPGGIGKTRLALEAATESSREAGTFPDGVWLVSLESLTEGREIGTQIAAVLEVRDEIGRPVLQSVINNLRDKRSLLVLDNCEHLLHDSAQTADALLRSCGRLRILATSREPLGIPGEVVWAVPSLTVPDPEHLPSKSSSLVRVLAGYEGVQLFVDRAQSVNRSFTLTPDTAGDVAQICWRLDGLPLAIELAAARTRVMTVGQISSRLSESLGLLTGRTRTAFSRQQTLRASLDWSHDLLSDPEQRLLRRLAVFAGGWLLDAVSPVCAGAGLPAAQTLDLLTSLVDKSLVVFGGIEKEIGAASGRFRLPESVRQYAAEKLEACGELSEVRTRHRDYFLKLAVEAEAMLGEADHAAWVKGMEAERSNMRTAMDWTHADPDGAEAGLVLAGALGRFWELRGYYSEGRMCLLEALRRKGAEARTPIRAKALTAAGTLACYQGDNQQAKALHEEGLAIHRELGDFKGVAWSLNDLGDVASGSGKDVEAKDLYERSLAIFRELNDRNGIASLLHHVGRLERDHGQYERARSLYEEGLANQRELGNDLGVGWALHHLGALAYLQGDLSRAWSLQEEARVLLNDLGNAQGVAWTLSESGRTAVAQGNAQAAETLCQEALLMFREMGNPQGVAATRTQLGALASQRGETHEARLCHEESLGISRAYGNRSGMIVCILAIAELELAEGRIYEAVRLWAAVEGLRQEFATSPMLRDALQGGLNLEQARTKLDPKTFDVLWSEGQALSLDQAADHASGRSRATSLT